MISANSLGDARPRVGVPAVAGLTAATGLAALCLFDIVKTRGLPTLEPLLGFLLLAVVVAGTRFGARGSRLVFELVFAILVGGTIIGDRWFSYLHIQVGPLPLYSTDYLLVLLLICIALTPGWLRLFSQPARRAAAYFGAYAAWGVLVFLLALRHTHGIQVFRDSALIYLAVFVPLGYFAVQVGISWRRIFLVAGAAGAVLFAVGARSSLIGVGIDIGYGLSRTLTGQSGLYLGLVAIVIAALLPMARAIRFRLIAAVFSGVCIVGLFLSQQRSAWIAVVLSMLLVMALGRRPLQVLGHVAAASVVAATIVGALALSHGELHHHTPAAAPAAAAKAPSDSVQAAPTAAAAPDSWLDQPTTGSTTSVGGSINRLGSGITKPEMDPTIAWRLAGWKEALRHIRSSPLTGDGMGGLFTWRVPDRLVVNYPHNTYLTVALKTGLVGALLLIVPTLLILGRAVVGVLRSVRAGSPDLPLVAVTAAALCLAVYGSFNLLLESPFLAWPTWTALGLTLALSDRVRDRDYATTDGGQSEDSGRLSRATR